MVYTSLPVYLDPPNWNQQQQQQVVQPQQPPPLLQGAGNHLNNNTLARDASNNNRHLPQQVPPPQHVDGVAVAGAGTVRTNSMADRARLAKIPQPEQALKCPRCDSTNTKFCYFNNYSLSQPRHFCKTCRRYWTRGGALRNVPVGGGCRRNKRSKSGGSKAASGTDTKAGPSCSATTGTGSVGVSGAIGANSLTASLQLPFLPSLHPLADYGSTNLGFNYCRIPTVDPVDYPAVTSSGIALEPWRLQQVHQLPFFAGIEPTTNVAQPPTSIPFYAFDEEATGPAEPSPAALVGQPQGKPPVHGLTITQLPQVKLEPNSQGINLETQHVRIHANDQYWREGGGGASSATGSVGGGGGGNGWTDLSGFSSTSTGVLL